jgi:hypothetical protein
MANVKIKNSKLHGKGVFAIKDLPKGTLLKGKDFENMFNDSSMLSHHCVKGETWVTIYHKYLSASFENRNVNDDGPGRFITSRDVKKGEELLRTYGLIRQFDIKKEDKQGHLRLFEKGIILPRAEVTGCTLSNHQYELVCVLTLSNTTHVYEG